MISDASTTVSAGWLSEHLGQPDLLVFDATMYLPTEAKDANALFESAHIPRARRFDIDMIADDETDLPHMVPTPGRFARMVGALGVSNATHVVFYDQKGLFSAARGWWMMKLFGHDRVSVLDGGLPAWVRAGYPTESGPFVPPATPSVFHPDFRARMLRGIGDMRSNVETGAELVLDARSAARFRAEAPEPRPGVRGGHIPGSRNIPFTDVLHADQTLRPAHEVRALLAAAGVDGSRPVVTSCGTGVTAAVLTLAMAASNMPIGALYDGAWTEWGGRPDTPVEVATDA